MKQSILTISLVLLCTLTASAKDISMKITKQYLNLPISHSVDRATMQIAGDKAPLRNFAIRLAPAKADYWVFADMTEYKGKTITISYQGDPAGLSNIYQADTIEEQEQFYKEENRPQFHFTARRGWINDPNGLIFYEGEYHLFYQHNPYERDWENMHWGHAVSTDLVHWRELPVALYPDKDGTMFSGTAVIDYDNTAGFNKGTNPAMIAYFTAFTPDRQVQGFAYSHDRGRTWTKYANNPVIDSKEKWNSVDTRDPKVFWYEPSKHWVMVLNERDGHSIYTSHNLKDWTYQSHTAGIWECPELFELPIDGNPNNTQWVMYGASGTYFLGSFDGKVFTPQAGKYFYTSGALYAAQTIANMPASDNRRIQIGWGRVTHPNMPFNGQMMMPTQLTLRTTKEGVRLFSQPIEELDQLFTPVDQWQSLSSDDANQKMKPYHDASLLRVKTTIKLSHATSAGFNLFGQHILDYDMNANTINGRFYTPEDRTSMELTADIYIDQTTIEVFIDGGAYSYSMERKPNHDNAEGHHFWGNNIEVKNLEVFSIESIWK